VVGCISFIGEDDMLNKAKKNQKGRRDEEDVGRLINLDWRSCKWL
jgi:hypothetical protein